MKNCIICNAVIDNNWYTLQNHVKQCADLSILLNDAFVNRCIYCYAQLLELKEKMENTWYNEIVAIMETRGKW